MVARIELFEQALILTPSFYHAITFDFACLPSPRGTSQPTTQILWNYDARMPLLRRNVRVADRTQAGLQMRCVADASGNDYLKFLRGWNALARLLRT